MQFNEEAVLIRAINDGELTVNVDAIVKGVKKSKSLYRVIYLHEVFGLTYEGYGKFLSDHKTEIDNSEITKKRNSIVKRINDKVTRLKDEIILGAEGKDVLKKIAELENFKI